MNSFELKRLWNHLRIHLKTGRSLNSHLKFDPKYLS